jgi:hypothetical protein
MTARPNQASAVDGLKLGPALGNPTGGFQPGVIDGKVLKQSIGKAWS